MPLKDYIKKNWGGSQVDFALSQGVTPQAVTRWIKCGYIVVKDVLYAPRRELK